MDYTLPSPCRLPDLCPLPLSIPAMKALSARLSGFPRNLKTVIPVTSEEVTGITLGTLRGYLLNDTPISFILPTPRNAPPFP